MFELAPSDHMRGHHLKLKVHRADYFTNRADSSWNEFPDLVECVAVVDFNRGQDRCWHDLLSEL